MNKSIISIVLILGIAGPIFVHAGDGFDRSTKYLKEFREKQKRIHGNNREGSVEDRRACEKSPDTDDKKTIAE